MFRLESKQNPLHAFLEPAGQGLVQGFGESLKQKKMSDLLKGLHEESPAADWMQAISAMPVSDAEKKMVYEYIGNQIKQKQVRKAAEEQAIVEQQKKKRQSDLMAKAYGQAGESEAGAPIVQATAQQPSGQSIRGRLTPDEVAELSPSEQRAYYKSLEPKAPAGGVTAQAVPSQISESIEKVLASNPKASADTLKLKMDQAGVPPIYSNEYIENRRDQQKMQSTVDEATEKKIDRSYERTKEFRDKTTGAYRGWSTEMEPRLRQMQILNDKNLASSSTVAFAESLGLPLSIFSNPDSELYQKLSYEMLKGLPDMFGSRILKVEVDNFLRTIPTLENSVDGRRRIISGILKIGEMKKALYDEMRSVESDYEDSPLPRDFEQKILERATPRLQQISKEFTELAKIKDSPPGHTLYFNSDSQAIWVPNTQEDRFRAEQEGMRPAYMSSPGEPKKAAVPTRSTQAPALTTQPAVPADQQVSPEQMNEMEQAATADPGSRYILASEYVDPEKEFLRNESLLGTVLRNAAGMTAAGIAGAAGVPGEMLNLAKDAVQGAVDFVLDPIFEGFVGQEKMAQLKQIQKENEIRLPTSTDVKKKIDIATGGYTAPKTKTEERLQTLSSDVGSAVISPGRALVGKAAKTAISKAAAKAGATLLAPVASNAAQVASEELLGLSPGTSELVKAGTWLAADMAGLVSGKAHASSLMNKARAAFTSSDKANTSRYMKRLNAATRGMLLNDPRSSLAMSQMNGIRNDLKMGNTSINDLMTRYDAINAAKRDAGMFSMTKGDRAFATKQLDKVLSVVRDEIYEAGKKNPEALESWKKGLQSFAVIHQGESFANFAKAALEGHSGKMKQGIAGLFLGGAGKLIHSVPAIGAASGVVLPPVYKSAQILHRVAKSPELRKYYWEAMKNLAKKDAPSFLKNYNILQKKYEEKYGE